MATKQPLRRLLTDAQYKFIWMSYAAAYKTLKWNRCWINSGTVLFRDWISQSVLFMNSCHIRQTKHIFEVWRMKNQMECAIWYKFIVFEEPVVNVPDIIVDERISRWIFLVYRARLGFFFQRDNFQYSNSEQFSSNTWAALANAA